MKDLTDTEASLAEWSQSLQKAAYLATSDDVIHAASLITHSINKRQPENPIAAVTAYAWLIGDDAPRTQEHYLGMVEALGFKVWDEQSFTHLRDNIDQIQRGAKKTEGNDATQAVLNKAANSKWRNKVKGAEKTQYREARLRDGWMKLQEILGDVDVVDKPNSRYPDIPKFQPVSADTSLTDRPEVPSR